jgi:hypothetical protein
MMGKFALMAATAAALAALVGLTNESVAQFAVTCGGTIQNCPSNKKMYCNHWRACKGRNAKVKRYCDQPVCMTERKSKN